MKKTSKYFVIGLFVTFAALTGCSKSDSKFEADKKAAMESDIMRRSLEERNCDAGFKGFPGPDLVNCWKRIDEKWKGIPSVYEGAPPPGFVRSVSK
jgi:hypothetical protein